MLFDDISCLQHGTPTQRRAWAVLTGHRVMEKSAPFDPVLTGTIPLRIEIETSDLDINCHWKDKAAFIAAILTVFEMESGFYWKEKQIRGVETIIGRFSAGGFPIDIFGQPISTRQQNACRHMCIEYQQLEEHGEDFRLKIIRLKKLGLKT